ncbi:hypothetical protein ACH5RR_012728 [Cinchona calisaya]|uniref:Uncharacterized protein n=1 Tax=Cinchona calisaya TaxID=153742 RepID=A0ABD3A8M7_9GENT
MLSESAGPLRIGFPRLRNAPLRETFLVSYMLHRPSSGFHPFAYKWWLGFAIAHDLVAISGKPFLSAAASWALPHSPIRCLDMSYTLRGANWAYGLALPFDLSSRVTRNALRQPSNCHRLASLTSTVHLVWSAPIVFGQRSLHLFTLVHPVMPWAFCSSNIKGGRPFVKAQESAGHLSSGISYPIGLRQAFIPSPIDGGVSSQSLMTWYRAVSSLIEC